MKLSDADLMWLLGIDLMTAFINPCVVRVRDLLDCIGIQVGWTVV